MSEDRIASLWPAAGIVAVDRSDLMTLFTLWGSVIGFGVVCEPCHAAIWYS